ncbi:MAG: hypothetical protein QY332_03015 [Anaerolineales bacterium]|nr:MAG: hypothetical protein QY332_03015 [Anaerolineales bacterium]
MNLLVLKLILAPVIIGSASLAGRRWGPAVSGWIVGMPLTSGPVIFFVALSHGASFAANASLGVISGGLSLVAYALTYSWLATRFRWPISIAGSLFIFSLSTRFLQNTTVSLLPIFVMVGLAILVGLWFMPNDAVVKNDDAQLSQWDIPVRIFIGTSFILLLTGIAPLIGSRMTGLLTTIPLYVTILSIFAHRDHGAAAAAHVMRGLLYGMFAFIGFFLILSLLIEKTSLGISFGAALLTALSVQGTSLFVLRKLHK